MSEDTLNVSPMAFTRTESALALDWAFDSGHIDERTALILGTYVASRRNALKQVGESMSELIAENERVGRLTCHERPADYVDLHEHLELFAKKVKNIIDT